MAEATIVEISPQAQELLKRFKEFPWRQICAALDYQNELTVGHISEKYLSQRGKTTLGVRTNTLRRSLRRSNAVVIGQAIESAIGSNVKYMGVHEFGYQGDVKVSPFTRRNKRRDVRRGKSEKVIAEGFSYVRSHSRKMNMPARAPIQHGIKDRIPKYSEALSGAIVKYFEGKG